jgi:hypothetical protein
VPADTPASATGDAIRFDMFDGEFTHVGNRCTFELLLEASGHGQDRALAALSEIVHDLDIRDDRFGRPEAPGVALLVEGIAARFADDARRIAESAPLFDSLYASLGGGR